MKRKIILASASPRRRELLTQIGIDFEIMVSQKEEPLSETDPRSICMKEAEIKARDIAEQAGKKYPGMSMLIIGADTVVAAENKVLGKPSGREEAVSMLKTLSGGVHQVYTGVCVIRLPENESTVFAEQTDVEVCALSDEDIEDYLSTGEPFDKAGAYGIQGYFARYVVSIKGDYNNVVGLPVGRLYRECLRTTPWFSKPDPSGCGRF